MSAVSGITTPFRSHLPTMGVTTGGHRVVPCLFMFDTGISGILKWSAPKWVASFFKPPKRHFPPPPKKKNVAHVTSPSEHSMRFRSFCQNLSCSLVSPTCGRGFAWPPFKRTRILKCKSLSKQEQRTEGHLTSQSDSGFAKDVSFSEP